MAARPPGRSRLRDWRSMAANVALRAWDWLLDRAATMRICGKSPVGAFLRTNEWIWNHLPPSSINRRPVRSCGHLLHALVRRWAIRRHYTGTFFLRNRPQLELIRRL